MCFLQMQTNSTANFYIVQTIENGISQLSAVPSTWVNNGKMLWPPKDKHSKAIKNFSMLPGTKDEGWMEYNCVVKRQNIPSYAAAMKELDEMTKNSDTSSSEAVQITAMTRPHLKRAAQNSKPINADTKRLDYNEVNILF